MAHADTDLRLADLADLEPRLGGLSGAELDQAFERIYRAYLRPVYAYAYVGLGDAQEAEDATQEIFMRLLMALPRYEDRGTAFRIWLFRIARNHLLDRRRSRLLERHGLEAAERVALAVGPARIESEASAELRDAAFFQTVAALPRRQREVLVLRFHAGLALRETAAVLGTSVSAVRNLQLRAFEILRPRLRRTRAGPQGPRAPVLRAHSHAAEGLAGSQIRADLSRAEPGRKKTET